MRNLILPATCCFVGLSLGCASTPERQTEAPRPAGVAAAHPVGLVAAPLAPLESPEQASSGDLYAEAEVTIAAEEGFCFLASPALTVNVAPFDGGIGLMVSSAHPERLRDEARILAGGLSAVMPIGAEGPGDGLQDALEPGVAGERQLVAGIDEESEEYEGEEDGGEQGRDGEDPIALSVEVQETPDGAMLVLVPKDPQKTAALMRRVQHDVAALRDGTCAASGR